MIHVKHFTKDRTLVEMIENPNPDEADFDITINSPEVLGTICASFKNETDANLFYKAIMNADKITSW